MNPPCKCPPKRHCCGEPEPQAQPEVPPPGWKPGDPRPGPTPFSPNATEAELQQQVNDAIQDLIAQSSTPKGPAFGPRKDEFLPYLVVRAFGGDHGARPTSVPFWESPDVFIAPSVVPDDAPPLPTTRGGIAQAGAPNTLWAHVWNIGRAPVINARVEFYWFDPSLGFSADAANFIGVAHVDLGDRNSGRSHTVVKCPVAWYPRFVNGGHECLVVRCFEPILDPLGDSLGPNSFAAWDDRHIAQRNIHVQDVSSPGIIQIALRLGCAAPPGPATIEVVPVLVRDMPWLTFLAGRNDHGYRDAKSAQEGFGLIFPTPLRSPEQRPDLTAIKSTSDLPKGILSRRIGFQRGCDELETIFFARVDGLQRGECRMYRVQQHVGGRLIGGYTAILRKKF
jgi:hypothetical protein